MKRITTIFILLLAVITLSAQDITGKWKGTLSFTDQMGNDQELSVVFNISKTDEGFSTTLDSPDQNQFDLPTDTTIYNQPELTIKKADIDVVYVGKVVDGTNMEGTLTQFGASLDLNLKKEAE